MSAFINVSSISLTSTTSTQTTTVPPGYPSIVVYNGGDNIVWLKWGTGVSVPTADTWTEGTWPVQPGTTQAYSAPMTGGGLSYIAVTAGGALTVSVGSGE